MFSLSQSSKLRGGAHIVLNCLRAGNIITLLCIAAASWVLIIKDNIKDGFTFFSAFAHACTSFAAIALILTEVNVFPKYVARNWPVFSPSHSLSWLGTALIIMGAQVLGSLQADKAFVDSMTLPLWQLCFAAGILAEVFGCFNLIASIVFRAPSEQLTVRMFRRDGALAKVDLNSSIYDHHSQRSGSPYRVEKRQSKFMSMFGRKEKVQISHPVMRTPSVRSHDVENSYAAESIGRHSMISRDSRIPMADDRTSPIMPTLQRPPTAQHPFFSKRPTSSRYSVAAMS